MRAAAVVHRINEIGLAVASPDAAVSRLGFL
jgi:hypothetical protein